MSYMHETTPERETELAQAALAAGDLPTAVEHVATALQFDPTAQTGLGLLQDLYRKSSDPLSLITSEAAHQSHLKAAVRAWFLAELQRWDEAFELILTSTAGRPDRPFLTWAADWIKRPGVAARLPTETVDKIVIPLLARIISDVPVPMVENDVRAANVRAAAKLIEQIHVVYPNSPEVLFARSLVTRRLGQFEHAIYFAYQAFQNQQDWKNAVGVALANRDAGKIDDAISWYRHAISLDPDDITARLEIGDTYLANERWDDAIKAYQAVLDREAEQNWAEASLAYARYKKSGEESFKQKLVDMKERSGRAWSLYTTLEPPQPYVHALPAAADATANALRGVIRQLAPDPQKADGGTVTLNVTHPESPSVLNAFRLWAVSRGVNVGVELQVERLQSPDPRTPKSEVDFTLWQYNGHAPSPAVDAADPRLAAAIGLIAQNPYNLEVYDQKAAELAEKIKLRPEFLPHLTATMVHPPPLPAPDQDPIEWVLRVQMACALLVSKIDTGWNPSARKRALFSLIMGPVDWTVDAALIVLAWLARDNDEIRAEASQMMSWMATQIPKEGYTCFEYPLACGWLMMGGHDDATRERLEAWKTGIEARGRAAPDAGPEEEIHDGLTLEEYAEFSAWRDSVLEQHGVAFGGEAVAPAGAEVYKRLEDVCRDFGLDPSVAYGLHGGAPGHLQGWEARIKNSPAVAEVFFAKTSAARRELRHD